MLINITKNILLFFCVMLLGIFFIANKALCERTFCKIFLNSGGSFEGYLLFEDEQIIKITDGISEITLLKKSILEIERKEIIESSSPETYNESSTIENLIVFPPTNSYFGAKKLYKISTRENIKNEKYKLILKDKKTEFLDALINGFHWDMTVSEFENITNTEFSECKKSFLNDKYQNICMKEVLIGDFKYDIYFFGDSRNFIYPTSIKIFPTVIAPTYKATFYIGNFKNCIKQLEFAFPIEDISLQIPNKVIKKIGDKYIIYSSNIADDTIFIEKNISSDVQHRNHLTNKKIL